MLPLQPSLRKRGRRAKKCARRPNTRARQPDLIGFLGPGAASRASSTMRSWIWATWRQPIWSCCAQPPARRWAPRAPNPRPTIWPCSWNPCAATRYAISCSWAEMAPCAERKRSADSVMRPATRCRFSAFLKLWTTTLRPPIDARATPVPPAILRRPRATWEWMCALCRSRFQFSKPWTERGMAGCGCRCRKKR